MENESGSPSPCGCDLAYPTSNDVRLLWPLGWGRSDLGAAKPTEMKNLLTAIWGFMGGAANLDVVVVKSRHDLRTYIQ